MAVIGVFVPHKDGGWMGTIRTLCISVKARIVPNDNRDSDRSPDFYVVAGACNLGAAWSAVERANTECRFLKVQIDCPSLVAPISAALFETDDGRRAHLVWNRRKLPS